MNTAHQITALLNNHTLTETPPITSFYFTSDPSETSHLVTVAYPTSNEAATALSDLNTHKPPAIISDIQACEPPPPIPDDVNRVFLDLPINYTFSTNCIVRDCCHSKAHVLTTEESQQAHY